MQSLIWLLAVFVGQIAAQQKLVWQQEFNGGSIDKNTWTFERGNNNGWGNNELEYYTNKDANCRIENNSLVIEGRREDYGGFHFTSARIKTEDQMDFKYGTLEARMKLPDIGKGLWPAFWLMGKTGDWPKCGEIDVLEAGLSTAINSGKGNELITITCHWWDYVQNGHVMYSLKYTSLSDLSYDFHVYKMVWDDQLIQVYVDNTSVYTFDISNSTNGLEAFHQPFYILINMAIGGNYPDIHDASQITSHFPAPFMVDYIRLYQKPTDELYLNGKRVFQ